MSDKKIIIIALILAAGLAIGGWYYTKNKPATQSGPAAISEVTDWKAKTAGIIYGNQSAPVIIEEYTNFLCPACASFATETFSKINETYIKTGKAKMIFYIYPPLELSKAAFCSQQQDKVVEFHDYMFIHQKEITQEKDIFDLAAKAGLDQAKLQACYATDEAAKAAQGWLDDGRARGVEATPTFYINGEKLVGAKAFEEFQALIDKKLSE